MLTKKRCILTLSFALSPAEFRGRVTDLNFSHSEQALLACTDEAGFLYVYEIVGSGGKVSVNGLL